MELLNYSDSEHEDGNLAEKNGREDSTRNEGTSDIDSSDSRVNIPQTKWAVIESSDEEENIIQVDEQVDKNEPKTISADVLLASISERPSFLSKPPSQKKFEIKPVVNHAYVSKHTPHSVVEPKSEPEKKEKTKAITRERFLAEQAKTQQLSGNPALDSIIAASKAEKDKESVKVCDVSFFLSLFRFMLVSRLSSQDRVKRQRLSGQSGIGEDFKVWKSEEEMRQRQHFD